MDTGGYIASVAAEGALLASTAERGDLAVPIAACPGWDMAELVRHLGMIHLWAAANVAFPAEDGLDVDDLPDLIRYWPELAAGYPNDDALVAWYRQTLDNLLDVLRSAPADVAAFALLPSPAPLAMWARRQASEIAIHRFDAEHARGLDSFFAPAFAADMTDELLSGFAPRRRKVKIAERKTIHAHAHDVDEHWHVTLDPEALTTTRTAGPADLSIVGTAQELYLLFWNRPAGERVRLEGEVSVINDWQRNCRIRWS